MDNISLARNSPLTWIHICQFVVYDIGEVGTLNVINDGVSISTLVSFMYKVPTESYLTIVPMCRAAKKRGRFQGGRGNCTSKERKETLSNLFR